MTSEWLRVLRRAFPVVPAYESEDVAIYCGDAHEFLPLLPTGFYDHVLTDPPYDDATHTGARTHGTSDHVGEVLSIGFAALGDPAAPVKLLQPKRWGIAFCALEMLGDYRRACGDRWVRGGFWHRVDGAPQFTGDRPAQPGEGLAIWHATDTKKRWNGGGGRAFWTHGVVRAGRVHETQKPEGLMMELVEQFTDPGDLVLDPFAGSGTTAVACRRLGRRCLLIEQNPAHVASAINRLAQAALPMFEPMVVSESLGDA